MRNKFSELIAQGVATFEYTPIGKEIPEQDPICRHYNNIFALPTNTHMSMMEDGTRVITGSMIRNKRDWGDFLCGCMTYRLSFEISGFYSVNHMLDAYGLCGRYGELNGDVVYFVEPCTPGQRECPCPGVCHATTNESRIPRRLEEFGLSKNDFKGNVEDVLKHLNENHEGDWFKFDDCFICYTKDNLIKVI
ncbi:MAG: hypothetical protein IKU29_02440 [Parabacteroides sp.]|nr:hypothetical protein [Parabacteroides sp.]